MYFQVGKESNYSTTAMFLDFDVSYILCLAAKEMPCGLHQVAEAIEYLPSVDSFAFGVVPLPVRVAIPGIRWPSLTIAGGSGRAVWTKDLCWFLTKTAFMFLLGDGVVGGEVLRCGAILEL